MKQFLSKFASRKFLMAAAALAAALTGSELEGGQLFVTGLVAAAYVLAEAFTDRGRVDLIGQHVDDGMTLGRSVLSQGEVSQVRELLGALAAEQSERDSRGKL